ncbi:hypothetical protein ABIB94_007084 [Bradyrhizobium sp. JR7.2]|uniref:hypothetical protein n=1 Tax=Bradyrhizobium sp. JR7.2 TaxID=3156375 RepID=UPI00339A8AC7
MPTDKQIDAATDAYLKARGWSDDTIKANFLTRTEVRGRMEVALKAAEEAADVQNAG